MKENTEKHYFMQISTVTSSLCPLGGLFKRSYVPGAKQSTLYVISHLMPTWLSEVGVIMISILQKTELRLREAGTREYN